MNCRDFQLNLPEMLADQLGDSLLLEAEQHLGCCPRCLVQWTEALTGTQSQPAQAKLASKVLNILQLDVCVAAQDALCEQKPEILALDESLAMHLETCPDCAALSQVVLQLNHELPALREIQAPIFFTSRVLARTSKQRPTPNEPSVIQKNTWRSLSKRISQRPRFAIEAAYVLSLSLVIAIGTPALGLDRRSDVDQIISSARSLGEQQSQMLREQNDQIVRSSREQWVKLYDTTYTQITTNTQRTQDWINTQAAQLMQTVEFAQETLFGSAEQQQNI